MTRETDAVEIRDVFCIANKGKVITQNNQIGKIVEIEEKVMNIIKLKPEAIEHIFDKEEFIAYLKKRGVSDEKLDWLEKLQPLQGDDK